MSVGFVKRPIDSFEFINLAIVSGAFASAFKDLNAQDFMEGGADHFDGQRVNEDFNQHSRIFA